MKTENKDNFKETQHKTYLTKNVFSCFLKVSVEWESVPDPRGLRLKCSVSEFLNGFEVLPAAYDLKIWIEIGASKGWIQI